MSGTNSVAESEVRIDSVEVEVAERKDVVDCKPKIIPVEEINDLDKMKCMASECPCSSFKMVTGAIHQCANCTHQWPFHILHRISLMIMLNPEHNDSILLSLTEEVMSMVLFGCNAIPVNVKILLDRLLSIQQQANVVRILHHFGWSFHDYSRGYMLMNEAGGIRTSWNRCSFESETLIIKQFLVFPETRQIAIAILASNKELSTLNHTMSGSLPEILAAMAMYSHSPVDRFFQHQLCRSKMNTNHQLPHNVNNALLNPSLAFLNRFPHFQASDDDHQNRGNSQIVNDTDESQKKNTTQQRSSSTVSIVSVQHRDPATMSISRTNLSEINSSQDLKCSSPKNIRSFATQNSILNSSTLTLGTLSKSKRRVLCTACKKTFCDKGALKIHYSAVHLREMHRCSIKGCNMWFSSRRSRNRHSSNPNPRLHLSHSSKKLPDNSVIVDDGTGRTIGKRLPIPSSILNPPIISTGSTSNDYNSDIYNDGESIDVGDSLRSEINESSPSSGIAYHNIVNNNDDGSSTDHKLQRHRHNASLRENNVKDGRKLFTINSVIE